MAMGPKLQFEWDESNRQHVLRHKVTTEEFEQAMFNDPMFIDLEEESGEGRWYALGPTNGMRMLFLVFTYHGASIRPITAWDAPKRLRDRYFKGRAI